MVKVTAADSSMDEFEKLTADAEDILRRLGLHYQVMVMCTGDMGFAQYKKYDLNAWCPGLGRYLEVFIETYQRADGTITVPEVLRPYMGGLEVIGER